MALDHLSQQLAARVAATLPSTPDSARWLWRWALLCAALALVLFAACGYHAGFERLNAAAVGLPGELWQVLTALGDERVVFALALLLAWRQPRIFWALLLAAIIATLCSRGLKPLVDAARPPALLPPESFRLIGPAHQRFSFPSGHSVTAAVFCGVLLAYARHWSARLLWLLLALAAGASRVALGVHWPIDVLAGLAGGALSAWAGVWLAERWPGGAAQPGVHLFGIVSGCVLVAGLLVDDGGYPALGIALMVLGLLTLSSVAWRYWWLPARCERSGHDAAAS